VTDPSRKWCVALAALSMLFAVRPARGDDAPAAPTPPGDEAPRVTADEPLMPPSIISAARARYDAGVEALKGRRYGEAALHFEAAGSLHPHAASWYMAAVAWEEAFRPERAADALSRALGSPELDELTRERATARLATLETSLATLSVVAPDGWRVQVDNDTEVPTPARLHTFGGTHALRVTPADRAAFLRPVTLRIGTLTQIALVDTDGIVEAPPVAPVERIVVRTEPPPGALRRTVGVGVLGLGVATVITAITLGATALDARDAYRVSRTQEGYDHVRLLQGATNVAWVGATLLVAGGAALVLWPSPRAPRAAGAPSAARLEARVSVGAVGLGGAF
jgi:hypothetical protein